MIILRFIQIHVSSWEGISRHFRKLRDSENIGRRGKKEGKKGEREREEKKVWEATHFYEVFKTCQGWELISMAHNTTLLFSFLGLPRVSASCAEISMNSTFIPRSAQTNQSIYQEINQPMD